MSTESEIAVLRSEMAASKEQLQKLDARISQMQEEARKEKERLLWRGIFALGAVVSVLGALVWKYLIVIKTGGPSP